MLKYYLGYKLYDNFNISNVRLSQDLVLSYLTPLKRSFNLLSPHNPPHLKVHLFPCGTYPSSCHISLHIKAQDLPYLRDVGLGPMPMIQFVTTQRKVLVTYALIPQKN